jgi:MFS family permease
VLAQPLLRRVMAGVLVSAIGDGMSMVAVAWLAVQIAPAEQTGMQTGIWTGLAVGAYSLPATIGTAVLGPFVRRFNGAGLVAVDASLRCALLGVIAALAVAGALAPAAYVALLAVSSLMHAWGSAGTYTLVAQSLPEEDQVTGNALLGAFAQAAFIVGPALAGILIAIVGPGWVIAGDAVSFGVLAALCWPAARLGRPVPRQRDVAVWGLLAAHPRLLGLTAVTCVFFFLYGPVEVALPVHVARELGASASLLGAYWVVLSVGAILGGLAAGLLRNRSLWTVVVAVIVGWGAALLPIGLSEAAWPGLVGFAIGGVMYGPYIAISTGLYQRSSPPEALSRVLALRTALTIPSASVGVLIGGPVVGALGGRGTLLASAILTIALGVVVAVVVAVHRSRRSPPDPGSGADQAARVAEP